MFHPLNCSQGCRANYRAVTRKYAVLARCPACQWTVSLADIVPHLDEGETVGILSDTVGYFDADHPRDADGVPILS